MPFSPSELRQDTVCICQKIFATFLAALFALSIAHSSWARATATTDEHTNASQRQGVDLPVSLRPILYPTLPDQQDERRETYSRDGQDVDRCDGDDAGRHSVVEKEQRRILMQKWDI